MKTKQQAQSPTVKRYFFDVIRRGQSEYDYSGRTLPSPEKAYELAELMAFDLAVACEEREDWHVHVCSAEGQKIFSIAVEPSYVAAA